jgi:hypothetical protein
MHSLARMRIAKKKTLNIILLILMISRQLMQILYLDIDHHRIIHIMIVQMIGIIIKMKKILLILKKVSFDMVIIILNIIEESKSKSKLKSYV